MLSAALVIVMAVALLYFAYMEYRTLNPAPVVVEVTEEG